MIAQSPNSAKLTNPLPVRYSATVAVRELVIATVLVAMPVTGAAIGRGNIVEPTVIETVFKLAVGAIALVASLVVSPNRRPISRSLFCLGGIGILGIVTAPFAVDVSAAVVDASLLIMSVLVVGRLAFDLGPERFLRVLSFTSAGLMMAGAGVARFFSADQSLFPADFGFGGLDRFSGVLSDANTLGQVAAVGVLATVTSRVSYRVGPAQLVCGLLCLGSLALSQSRTAAVALVVAVALGIVRSRRGRASLLVAATVVGLAVGATLTLDDLTKGPWSRSGSTDEIATVTGRTSVWKAAAGRVDERPVIGFGAGSAPRVMSEEVRAGRIVWPALHAHNAALQAMLTGGLVGLGLLVGSVVFWFGGDRTRELDPFVWLVVLGTTTEVLLNRAPSTYVLVLAGVFSFTSRD